MIKTFKQYNESVKDLLKGKSDEDILNSLKNLNGINIFKGIDYIKKEGLLDYMPPKQIIIDALNTYPTINKVYYVILCQLPFEMLEFERINDGIIHYYGSLYFDNCRIKKLPVDLYVHYDLYLDGNLLTELPKGLRVGGTLTCKNNPVKLELPKDASVDDGFYN